MQKLFCGAYASKNKLHCRKSVDPLGISMIWFSGIL